VHDMSKSSIVIILTNAIIFHDNDSRMSFWVG